MKMFLENLLKGFVRSQTTDNPDTLGMIIGIICLILVVVCCVVMLYFICRWIYSLIRGATKSRKAECVTEGNTDESRPQQTTDNREEEYVDFEEIENK